MIELTPTAQSRLNSYLYELHRVLSGSPSVDPADVERDVRDHIDAALVGHAAPVDASALDDVLGKLGSPAQWLPEGESRPRVPRPSQLLSGFRQAILQAGRRLAGGPESYRLAYLSFLLFVAGWSVGFLTKTEGFLVITTFVSFIFSRAALSLFTPQGLTGGQKWLLYPSLAVVYLPIALLIVLAPLWASLAILDLPSYHRGEWSQQEVFFAVSGLTSFVWFFIGLVGATFPGAVRGFFHPFAGWFSRRVGVGLATFGLIAILIVGTLLFAVGLPDRPMGRRSNKSMARPSIKDADAAARPVPSGRVNKWQSRGRLRPALKSADAPIERVSSCLRFTNDVGSGSVSLWCLSLFLSALPCAKSFSGSSPETPTASSAKSARNGFKRLEHGTRPARPPKRREKRRRLPISSRNRSSVSWSAAWRMQRSILARPTNFAH
jgi:hypothetical protein